MGIDYLHLMMLYNVHFSCITAAAGTRSTKVIGGAGVSYMPGTHVALLYLVIGADCRI